MLQKKFALAAAECYALDAGWMLCASMIDRGGIDFSLETEDGSDDRPCRCGEVLDDLVLLNHWWH